MTNFETQPVAVLRPSSSEMAEGGIYNVSRGIFKPTPTSVREAIAFLKDYDPSQPSSIKSINDKRTPELGFSSPLPLSLRQVEKICVDRKCNVLGGLFLAYMSSYGIEVGRALGIAKVMENDVEFMTTLYPDLAPYFAGSQKLDVAYTTFARAVVYNNTGSFKVIEIGNSDVRVFPADFLRKTAYLKRIYRYGVSKYIPWDRDTVRDNLVHTPETKEELDIHMRILRPRFINEL